jgi:hypothetical protein
MAGKKTMVFWRDIYDGPACVEYSWVPQGIRRVIQLNPKEDEGARADATNADVSHVQVYRLTSNGRGADGWQFPPGPPYTSPVIYAAIELSEQQMEVVGTVHYADGTSKRDTYPLKERAMPCPEIMPNE